SQVTPSRTPPATATPSAMLVCCETAAMAVAWLASPSSISANTSVLEEVKKIERRKPATKRTRMMVRCGVAAVKNPLTPIKAEPASAEKTSTERKPKALRTGLAATFMASAPKAETKVSRPEWKGERPNPT